MNSHRIVEWPWPGRVAIRERHPDGTLEEAHVFERWSHIGTARSEDELEDLAHARAEIDFDPDIYRILVGFFAKHRRAAIPLTRMTLDEEVQAA